MVASVASAGAIRSQVFGLGAVDPQTLTAVLVITLGLSALAGYLPARRASRIEPLSALKVE
jgi:ABC-type lipoprotein release transport system permease subunit